MSYDVVVVGAGPAGAVAAKYAAEKGANTLIIDRKREIGKPVRCAEVIAGTLPSNFGMKNSSEWLVNETHFFKFISPKGRVVEIKTSPYVGYVLDRVAFEQELLWMAVDKGAKLLLGKTATNLSKEGVVIGNELVKAKIIIGADGVDSKIGRLAGINTRSKIGMLGSCAQHTLVNIDVDSDCLEFYLGGSNAPGGYAWIFPKGGNEANVGVGILKPYEKDAVNALDNFIKKKFRNARSIRFSAGCVPSTLPPKECVKGNVVLVGDAAKHVNPFTGAGIANAFVAGKIAGEICGEVAFKKNPVEKLKEYDRLWKDALEKNIERGYRLRSKVLAKDKSIERFCLLLNLIPRFILRRLVRNLHY